MDFTVAAGLGGIGFVLVAVVVNVIYVRGGLPMPVAGKDIGAVTDSFATVGDALRKPSVLAPAMWLFTTVFAAGLLTVLGDGGGDARAWALVGFAGVIMQNATFTCVEALRFGMAAAASHGRGSMAGLWGLSNVLFGFNQVFLAIALLGFTAAGADTGFIAPWHAWLGYASAVLLFISSAASPYNAGGASRIAPVGLIGWLGWATWIVIYSIELLRL
ncbi:hypothetical protein H7J87_17240 [Mycolicibacterium wolinskyi]|uniref:DUF4386 domain-containing protein n=1 Tax=Mycolicibacterium wolinskyi TaxID=59750 RepID=A0A1X2EUB2_9MYCO|nr:MULTISPECIES: hypothetical protein [Mycolicibacterium]MCV7287070.1 hypothetical protein [Mycolicibacterium wolinskyi]MCV7292563.1 hypothetical protein [Mycolicibacterium goodii]ORX09777.1 hypothetical protein AWC31_06030 [Mycolicibacterium wolinskyi]